jgi:hypothetical protein
VLTTLSSIGDSLFSSISIVFSLGSSTTFLAPWRAFISALRNLSISTFSATERTFVGSGESPSFYVYYVVGDYS